MLRILTSPGEGSNSSVQLNLIIENQKNMVLSSLSTNLHTRRGEYTPLPLIVLIPNTSFGVHSIEVCILSTLVITFRHPYRYSDVSTGRSHGVGSEVQRY